MRKKVLAASGMMLALFMAAPVMKSEVVDNVLGVETVYAASGSQSVYGGGTWEFQGGTQWKLKQSNGSYLCNAWYQDIDGSWYYLKADGLMAEQVFTDTDGSVYLLDWRHDGKYGKLLTSGTYNGVSIQTNDSHDGSWGRILNTEVITSLKEAIGQTNSSTTSEESSAPSVPDPSDPWHIYDAPGGTQNDIMYMP